MNLMCKRERFQYVEVILVITFLVIVSIVPASSCNESENSIYYEDTRMVLFGRCRTISSSGEWSNRLLIGELSHAGVHASDTWLEGVTIVVYNKSYAKGFPRMTNTIVNIDDAVGIFFFGERKQFGARLVPPIVFVWCHAEKLWIT